MKELVLDITPTGRTTGLHFDKFPLSFLGPMKVGRASEIKFNEEIQLWDITLPGDEVAIFEATGFDSYDDAREFEVEWLQGCMKKDVHPTSKKGSKVASRLRLFDCS